MATKDERIKNLEKGIESISFRLAALALKFANSKTEGFGENPRDLSRQINEYGRTKQILLKEYKELVGSGETNNNVDVKIDAPEVPVSNFVRRRYPGAGL